MCSDQSSDSAVAARDFYLTDAEAGGLLDSIGDHVRAVHDQSILPSQCLNKSSTGPRGATILKKQPVNGVVVPSVVTPRIRANLGFRRIKFRPHPFYLALGLVRSVASSYRASTGRCP
jgi:hypothetical protein